MTTVNAEAFVKDVYANPKDGNKDEAPQYVFDSKKEVELKRLNEQHYALMELQRDRLVHSSIDRPKRILDVRIDYLYDAIPFTAPVSDMRMVYVLICRQIGCGTGVTTVTIARKFPEAEVIGVDINPVSAIPDKPKNVTFIQGRVEDIMASVTSGQPFQGHDASFSSDTFGEASFDYVFARLLTCVISTWPELISTCVSLLRPGGWLEMQVSSIIESTFDAQRSHLVLVRHR
jgi:SAM-dependent methyltransferase